MKLLTLKLKNFKGIRSFNLDTRGENISVFGDNASGKTTLFDAFCWLLFDKDSLNRKDFEIKTLDADGKPLHGLEHEVEAELELAGQTLTLRKVYREVWTKKRGAAQTEFSGHTTDYFIDGVPAQKSEYTARINNICDEQTFRLLTDVTYFNEQLHWQQRRRLLLDVCGDISDVDVIAHVPSLKDLPAILSNRTLDDHRKVIQARRTEINRELDKLPVRIDEVERGLPDKPEMDAEQVEKDIIAAHRARGYALTHRINIDQGGGVAEKTKQLREAEAAAIEIETRERQVRWNELQPLREQEAALLRAQAQFEASVQDAPRMIYRHQDAIQKLEAQRERLRDEWRKINSETFVPSAGDTCPTCGQALPFDAVQEANEKAMGEFNHSKAQRLEQVAARGKAAKDESEDRQRDIDAITAENKVANNNLGCVVVELHELSQKIDLLASGQVATAGKQSAAMLSALERITTLKAEIDALRQGKSDALQQADAEIATIDGQVEALRDTLARIEQRKAGQERIADLKTQQKNLATELERLEKELYLTEEFIRAKVSMLEERINIRFKLARVKLFDVQVNGAVAECCETTFGGVPYGSGLNKGARINVGIDIINTLAGHYKFTPPVIVDNAEAVVELLPTRGQLIRLVVSGEDKKLRVVTHKRESVSK